MSEFWTGTTNQTNSNVISAIILYVITGFFIFFFKSGSLLNFFETTLFDIWMFYLYHLICIVLYPLMIAWTLWNHFLSLIRLELIAYFLFLLRVIVKHIVNTFLTLKITLFAYIWRWNWWDYLLFVIYFQQVQTCFFLQWKIIFHKIH